MSGVLKLENTCPNCGKKIKMGLKFCNYCGSDLGQYEINCPNCGKSIKLNRNFCNYCGIDLIQYKIDKFEESLKGFKPHRILRIIAGCILLFSAFLHLIFPGVDIVGTVLYYWIFGDPEETGLEIIFLFLLNIIFALILTIVHAIFYVIMGYFLLGFQKNKIVPSFSIVFSIIGIVLALRVMIVFGYITDYIIFLLIMDSIVLAISIYALVVPAN